MLLRECIPSAAANRTSVAPVAPAPATVRAIPPALSVDPASFVLPGFVPPLFFQLEQAGFDLGEGIIASQSRILERLLALQIERDLHARGVVGKHMQLLSFCLLLRVCLTRSRLKLMRQLLARFPQFL